MPLPRILLAQVTTLALAGTALATVTAMTAASAVSTERAGPGYHQPQVGVCYDYGIRGYYAATGPQNKVDCDESHRAMTVAVVRVKGKIDRQDDTLFNKVGTRCLRAMNRTIGGSHETRALTAYILGWFVPTQAEIDKGARWIRCDLVLAGGYKLMPLPDPLLPDPLDDTVALCLTGENTPRTVCEREHAFRATGVVKVKGAKYPSEQKIQSLGEEKCKAKTSSSRYLWRPPGPLSWKAGKHLLTCFTKTKN